MINVIIYFYVIRDEKKMYILFILLHIFLLLLIIFSEYLLYFIVLYKCKWPQINYDLKTYNREKYENELRVVMVSDLHLLGKRHGHWFDKLRREWQMYRSFQTLINLHNPEMVFILGDIFDEGSFSPDETFLTYVKRFSELFSVHNKTEIFVVAGNHDIGFHYAMNSYLEYRFRETLNAPSVLLVSRKNIHFVLINSMALEKDGCNICRRTEEHILFLTSKFRCSNGTGKCYSGMKLEKYSRPILLQHFPLYRLNDGQCYESDSPSQKHIKFKEKWDCLSKQSTSFLLDKLFPRLVFSGHTHHTCHLIHKEDIHEYTIPSFNWRNKPNPSFAMVTLTEDRFNIFMCHLPHEYFVIIIYLIGIFIYIICFFKICRTTKRSAIRKKIV